MHKMMAVAKFKLFLFFHFYSPVFGPVGKEKNKNKNKNKNKTKHTAKLKLEARQEARHIAKGSPSLKSAKRATFCHKIGLKWGFCKRERLGPKGPLFFWTCTHFKKILVKDLLEPHAFQHHYIHTDSGIFINDRN